MEHKNYKCPKCGNRTFEKDTIATTGSGLSKFFDLQNRKFAAISCSNCGYTELFKTEKAKSIENLFDLFTS